MRSTARRDGFTIIEMLAVMVVIGVLATIAFARLQSSKDKAVVAGMVSDLHAVAEEQEAYYFQNRSYSPTIELHRRGNGIPCAPQAGPCPKRSGVIYTQHDHIDSASYFLTANRFPFLHRS